MSGRIVGVRCARALLVAAALCAALPASADPAEAAGAGPVEDQPVFLVTQIDVGPDVPIDADTARDVLARRFARLKGRIDVRSLSEVKTSLDQAALSQMLGGEDQGQLEKLEQYVDVDRVVFGGIKNVGGILDVNVRVFNVREVGTEIALSRRLKADAPPSLVLTVLESLADSLLAWTIRTYTDEAPSTEYASLAAKKLAPPPAPPAPVEQARPAAGPGIVGVSGLVMMGGGAGLMLVGGANTVAFLAQPRAVDLAALGAGAGLLAVGGGLAAYDLLVE